MKSRPTYIRLSKKEALRLVIRHHYLHSMCPISYAFGIEVDGELKGVCTTGRAGFARGLCNCCGKERSHDVFELNRLWIDDCLPRNSESRFIGWCLRQLRRINPTLIVVSYADTKQGHVGYVYQSTNWIYTGTSARFSDRAHGRTVYRSVKHRYIWFANRCDRARLKWPDLPYPKRAMVAGA